MKLKNISMSLALASLLLFGCSSGGTATTTDTPTTTVAPTPTTTVATEFSTATIYNYELSVEPITQLYLREINTTEWKQYSLNADLTANTNTDIIIQDCNKEYEFKAIYANNKDAIRSKYNLKCGEKVDVWFWLYHSTIPIENIDCSIEGQNKMLYDIMHDGYFWYEYTPELDYSSYLNKEKLLNDLMYTYRDRWSYVATTEGYLSYYDDGAYIGVGYSVIYINDKVYIRYVYKDSSASNAGLKRGVEILAINGKTIKEIEDNDLWSTISGKAEVGVEVNLKIDKNSIIEDIKLVKDKVTINSVLDYKVLAIDSQKIGYLLFNTFIEPSREELKIVFEKLNKENIDKLILDLRYNGGGRLDVARYLASLIGGIATNGKNFKTITYNDRYTHWNRDYKFSDENISLGLDSVYIITTENTASASESVINGLKPFLNVHLIGSRTHGKPVGMNGYNFCNTHVSPIQFTGINANGEGDYFDGFSTACNVEDDILHDFGDIEESMLKETLFYMKNDKCSNMQEKRFKGIEKRLEGNNPFHEIYQGLNREIGAL